MNKTQSTKDFSFYEVGVTKEYVEYAIDSERAYNELQKRLMTCDNPKDVALCAMKSIVEFYDAEWCRSVDVDSELGVWNAFWWYSRKNGAMATTLCKDIEYAEDYARWFNCLKEHQPVVITSVEDIKNTNPVEYERYQYLQIESVIAVPFWMQSKGFLVLKNPKRYKTQTAFIRLLTFAVVTSVNEYRLMETNKLSFVSPRITSDADVYISLFGELEITTSKGRITESELKSPKIARILVYLLLSRKAGNAPREIADTIWSEEDSDMQGKNMKGLVYRLQQAFSLISDYRLIESTVNGYQLNPKLNITTDVQLFNNKWDNAMAVSSSEDKEDILKKMVELYTGDILHSASSEHWIMPHSTSLQYRYIGAVNELMRLFEEERHYHHIRSYAAKALLIVPHDPNIYYWLIHAMYKQGHTEMARSEMKMAQTELNEEEYDDLVLKVETEIME